MSKKVLIIETSLRPNSNSDKLAESFAEGARAAGNEVEVVSPEYVRADICEKAKDVVNLYEGMQATKK